MNSNTVEPKDTFGNNPVTSAVGGANTVGGLSEGLKELGEEEDGLVLGERVSTMVGLVVGSLVGGLVSIVGKKDGSMDGSPLGSVPANDGLEVNDGREENEGNSVGTNVVGSKVGLVTWTVGFKDGEGVNMNVGLVGKIVDGSAVGGMTGS